MIELFSSIDITFSKEELMVNGLESCIDESLRSLVHLSTTAFVDLVLQNLKEEDNRYQFTLTIESLDE